MNYTADDIIRIFDLKPLPGEGGWYSETHRSSEFIPREALDERYSGPRAYSTVIYYMITADDCSKMHRVASDEIFCYHMGDPVKMLLLFPGGAGEQIVIGSDLAAGQIPQMIVPAGTWFGCCIEPQSSRAGYSLMSCIVAPGFEFEDYQQGQRDKLLARYPEETDLIKRLT
jgi:predicted cupin superfamily sugar epimerase